MCFDHLLYTDYQNAKKSSLFVTKATTNRLAYSLTSFWLFVPFQTSLEANGNSQ